MRATLDFIEARLLRTRRWSREERRSVQVNAPLLVAATFRHVTSRNNDPQLHTHCVAANMTRDRLAAAARAGEAAEQLAAVLATAEGASLDGEALEAAGARLERYRSLETALAAADGASARLPPDGALFDGSLEADSMERHGAACREAAAAFGIVAREAEAAGEAALAAGADGKASNLGQAAQHWAYKLESRRHTLAVTAEQAMAPPVTAEDVRAWRELRARQAEARERAAALAVGVAAAAGPEHATAKTKGPARKSPHAPRRVNKTSPAHGIHNCWASIRESMRTWVRITTRLRQADGALIVNRQDTRPTAALAAISSAAGPLHLPHENLPDELTDSHKMRGHVGNGSEKYRVTSTR